MDEKQIREKQITRTSLIGILANVCLAGAKALVGLLAGSIAIVLDAVNNLTDAVSSLVTIIGIKLAKRQPDSKHPYGHGRVEYFSALIISGIVLAAGIMSLVESVKKIIHPATPDYGTVTLVIVAMAVAVKYFLGRYVKAQGVKYNSDSLVASGTDASMDALISSTTLICAIIFLIFHISLDAWFGAVISFVIIKAGVEMLSEPVDSMIGRRPDSEITLGIKKTVREIPGVRGAYDLVLHNYGPDAAIGSIHVEISDVMTAHELHALTMKIQDAVKERYNVFLTVGIYAVDENNPMRRSIFAAVNRFDGVIGTHGFFADEEKKQVSFDAVLDFSVRDKNAMREQIRGAVRALYPDYDAAVNFDTNYSD